MEYRYVHPVETHVCLTCRMQASSSKSSDFSYRYFLPNFKLTTDWNSRVYL
jgi:hypothetical protein